MWFEKKVMSDTKDYIRVYLQPAFLICVLVLAAAGAGMSVTMKKLGIVFKKEPLPLKKSLEDLDESDDLDDMLKEAKAHVAAKQKFVRSLLVSGCSECDACAEISTC